MAVTQKWNPTMGWDGIAQLQQVECDAKDAFGRDLHLVVKSQYVPVSTTYQLGIWVDKALVSQRQIGAETHSRAGITEVLDNYLTELIQSQKWRAEVMYNGALVPWGGWLR